MKEIKAKNVPAGLGDPIYQKLDANLATALMSINDRPVNANASTDEMIEHENRIYWSTWGISLLVTINVS